MKKAKVSKYGQWKYPGQDTIIPNANGSITMKGVPYPVLGIDDRGNQQMMMPGGEYQFPGNSVYEIPMAKNGGTKKVKIKSLPKAQPGLEVKSQNSFIPIDADRYGINKFIPQGDDTQYNDPALFQQLQDLQTRINPLAQSNTASRQQYEKRVLDAINKIEPQNYDVTKSGYIPESIRQSEDVKNNGLNGCISGVCYTLNEAGEPVKYYSNSVFQDAIKDGTEKNWELDFDTSNISGGDIVQFTGDHEGPHHAALVVPSTVVKNKDGTITFEAFMNHGDGPMLRNTYTVNPKDDRVDIFGKDVIQLIKRKNPDTGLDDLVAQRDQLKNQMEAADPAAFTKGRARRWNTYMPGAFKELGVDYTNFKDQDPLRMEAGSMMQNLNLDDAGKLLINNTINNDVDYTALRKSAGFEGILNQINDPEFKMNFMKDLNITNREYNAIVSHTFGIYGQETGFGTKASSIKETDVARKTDSVWEDLKSRLKGDGPFQKDVDEDYSRGLTQVKLRNIKGQDKRQYGINKESIDTDPTKAFLASMITNAQNLPELRKLANKGETDALGMNNYLDFIPYMYNQPKRIRRGDRKTIEEALAEGQDPSQALVIDPNSPMANNEYIKNVRTYADLFKFMPTTSPMPIQKFGGALPKAQTGPGRGPGRGSGFLYGQPSTSNATYQDSLDVANQGQAVMDWYNSQGYYGGTDLSSDYVDVRARGERRTNYSGGRGSDLNFGRDDVNSGYNIHVPGSIGDAGLNLSNSMHNLVDRDNIAEWINPNQFRQYADQNLVILNDNAPKALYDTRIKPRTFLELRGMAPGYFSGNTDIVNAPIYEKWYSAPWVGLSEEDKRKRIQFGILDGTPYDGWDDPDLASRFPDLIGGGSSSDTQTYDAETVKNAGLSGYEATQEGAAEYARNNWARKEAEKKKDPNPDTDVVHYMREVEGRSRGETTYENRKKIAEELGIDNYSGTAQQNIELIKRLKEQKSAKENVAETVVIPEREMRPQIIPNTPAKEIDGERRAYPIKFTGDGATDKMIMQLYGPQGEFTDNGYIPLDDPKYNPYKTLMPKAIRDQQEIKKLGGFISKAQRFGDVKLDIPQQFQQAPNFMDVHVAMPKNSGSGDFTTHRVPSVYDAVKSGDFNHMEDALDKYFGYPQDRAFEYVDSRQEGDNDPSDNERHAAAGLFTQQAVKDKIGIPVIGDAAGWFAANAMGFGHELGTIVEDERPWGDKIKEGFEDLGNNLVGTTLGLFPGSQDEKLNVIHGLSVGNWLPDGVVADGGKNNLYLKDEQGNVNRDSPMDMYNRMFQKKQGGAIKQVKIKSLPKAQSLGGLSNMMQQVGYKPTAVPPLAYQMESVGYKNPSLTPSVPLQMQSVGYKSVPEFDTFQELEKLGFKKPVSVYDEMGQFPEKLSEAFAPIDYGPFSIPEDYYTRLMHEENGINTGLRDGRFYQYPSHEKGTDTIGYGHKLTEEESKAGSFNKGLTKDEAIGLMRKDVDEHLTRAKEQFNEEHGSGSFDKLHPDLKVLALDFVYNGIPINEFPNFFGAAKKYSTTKNTTAKKAAYDKMMQQYVRHDDKGVPLGSRNEYTKYVLENMKQTGGALTKAQSMGQFGDWRNMLDYKNAAPPAKQNLVGDVRKVARPTAVAESTKVPTQKLPDNYKELQQQKIAQDAYDALPEAMKRRDVLTADTRSDTEKFARRAWTAVSQPMETIAAVNKGYDIPSGYMGMHDAYEGYDVGSPMTTVVDMPAGIIGFLGNAGYRQGEQIVDDPLNYAYTMSPLGLLDSETRGQALGNYLDLAAVIPTARMAAGPLVKNAYKINPWAGKLGPYNRVVGSDAIADLRASGLVRSGEGAVTTMDGIPVSRPTAWPSFAKGAPKETYINGVMARGDTPYIISTNRPMGVSTFGRHGKGSTQFPIGKDGKYLTSFPASEASVYEAGTPHWLNGYKQVIPESRMTVGPLIKNAGEFLTTQTPLRNAYKYNPWAFKPDADAAYRMIGNEAGGYADAVHSGVFRPNPTRSYQATFYNAGAPYERYGSMAASGEGPQFIAKVPLSNPKLQPRFEDDVFRVTRDNHVGIHEPGVQIFKEHWLRGYKPVKIGTPQNTPKPFYPGVENFKFTTNLKQGGSKKKQPGFQVLTDANGKYVFVKT